MGMLGWLGKGLAKTKEAFSRKIEEVFSGRDHVKEEDLEELEAVLIQADLGHASVERIMKALKERIKGTGSVDRKTVEDTIAAIVGEMLAKQIPAQVSTGKPHVTLILGVNGTGKTTTAGKLAYALSKDGNKVVLGAADTFRAAAIDQLAIWAQRAGAELVRHQEGSDPSAVAFDSAKAAVKRGADYLIIDTAGRLHTKRNLMEELKKVSRVVSQQVPGAPHEVLIVIDATTGQNGLTQAKEFNKAVPLTGIALTKLDGTAKGGIVVAVAEELGVPVMYVGVGEGVEDLRPFIAEEFVRGLFS